MPATETTDTMMQIVLTITIILSRFANVGFIITSHLRISATVALIFSEGAAADQVLPVYLYSRLSSASAASHATPRQWIAQHFDH